jgi:hypothetical protein
VPINDGGVNKLYADGGLRHMVFLNSGLLERINKPTKPVVLYGIVNNTYLQTNLLSSPDGAAQSSFKKMSILDVATRSAALAENQLYLDSAWITNGALGVSTLSGWTDASSAKSCKPKQASSLFDPTYERCLMKFADEAATDKAPWKALQPVPTLQ